MNSITKKRILFTIIFAVAGFAALQVPLTHLAGSKATFTLFDSFAPIAGGFIGGFYGAVSVLLMQLLNFAAHGHRAIAAGAIDAGTIIRFLPAIFSAIYFSRKNALNLIVPILAIIAFNLNPVGRTVWYYSLFWLIPIATYFWQDKLLAARALGATFTAHAVGGALWIYFFHLPKAVWVALIPIVAVERIVFAAGICASYLAVNKLLAALIKKKLIPDFLSLENAAKLALAKTNP